MTKASQIEHLCLMIASNVSNHSLELNSAFGYLNRLEEVVKNGGYAAPETCEEIQLRKAAGRLRELADKIEVTRALMMNNAPALA